MKFLQAIVLCSIVALLLVGCVPEDQGAIVAGEGQGEIAPSTDTPEPSAPSEGEIVFGYLGPLSGDVSAIGQGALAAVEMAVQEINTDGGLNGKRVRVIAEDGRCNSKDAASAGNKLINVDKVRYIIGGGCSGETLAVTPMAQENKVIMLSPLSSSPDVTSAGDYIFRDYVNDNDAAKVLAQKMYAAGHRKVALLHSLNDAADPLAVIFNQEFQALGGQVVVDETFTQGTSDLRNVITKVKSSDADSVVLFEYTAGAITYLKQRAELGLEVPTYGVDTLSDPDIVSSTQSAAEGMRYVLLTDSSSDVFVNKMLERTGESPKVGSSNAYDAVFILANAIKEVGDDTRAVKEWLYDMPAYNGESGVIEFDENGDLKGASFDLLEIQNGKPVVVS